MNWLDSIRSFLSLEPDKLFHPGQEITMVRDGNWSEVGTGIVHPGPKFGEIVKCKAYTHLANGQWYISVIGYAGSFREYEFATVISDDQLEEMLNDIDELIVKTHGTY